MALNAYLKLKGSRQGDIKGSIIQKGREGNILVIAANHEIMSPTSNLGSGAGVGKRVHKPFLVTKELDKSSPLLYQAMIASEMMNSWELDIYAADAHGVEKLSYTVILTNPIITDIKFALPNTKVPETTKLNPYEIVEFTYQGIQWTWVDGGITASDRV